MHIRRYAWLGLLPALVVSLPAAAAEDIETIVGEWEQIASNAGACPTCRITFETRGKSFTVTANNGWAATLSDIRATELSGAGEWDASVRGWPAGHAFTIHFRREGDRLQMTMTVDTGSADRPIVTGTFRRPWQGV